VFPRRPELAILFALTVSACASAMPALPMAQYVAPAVTAPSTAVGIGDQLAVEVWNSAPMTTSQRVRDDGTISLFFLGDLSVAGLTTAQIADRIAAGLEGVLVSPQVRVVLEEPANMAITVLGEVARPGAYPVRRVMTLLEVLGLAGGLTEFAKRDRIYVLRGGAESMPIRVSYAELLRGEDRARNLVLRGGDAVVVE